MYIEHLFRACHRKVKIILSNDFFIQCHFIVKWLFTLWNLGRKVSHKPFTFRPWFAGMEKKYAGYATLAREAIPRGRKKIRVPWIPRFCHNAWHSYWFKHWMHGTTLPADRFTKIGKNAGSLELYFFLAFNSHSTHICYKLIRYKNLITWWDERREHLIEDFGAQIHGLKVNGLRVYFNF